MSASSQELLHAYRKLLRAGLRAVQFSKPSRYVIRDQLRAGFRDDVSAGAKFEPERIRRTVWFLNAAAQEKGLEHKILKNLCRVRFEQVREMSRGSWKSKAKLAGDRKKKMNENSNSSSNNNNKNDNNNGGDERLVEVDPIQAGKYEFYDLTVKMLNDSMGMCLR